MIKSPLKGSGLKLNVYVAQIGGIHLAECDFECTFFTFSRFMGITLTKDQMTYVDEDNYIATIDSSVLSPGRVSVLIKVQVPDGEFKGGYRTEIAELATDETIYP